MNNPLRQKAWSPYVVGIGIGLLSWFTFATADKALGITTSFENTAALIGKAPAPQAAQRQAYYRDPSHKAKIDWQWALVVGVFVGAWVSSKLSGDREKVKVPALWQARFGPSVTRRMTWAFIGGTLMMFGARLADGCTSGHGISGALQLAVSSWLFVALLFASAIPAALLIYGREGGRHV